MKINNKKMVKTTSRLFQFIKNNPQYENIHKFPLVSHPNGIKN